MPFLRLLLIPLSCIYGFIVYLRNKLFDYQILTSKSYSVPIISVGNLCSGGSGKTPLVEYLINLLGKSFKIAVLSRGYGRESKGMLYVTKNSHVKDVGDEPLQIAQKFPKIIVAVSESRNFGICELINKNCDLIILDDAYQHRSVNPGLSILVSSYNNLFTNDYLLPYGNLRESKYNYTRADIIVVSKTPYPLLLNNELKIKKKISPSSNQKLCFSNLNYDDPIELFSNYSISLENKKIILVTAIASIDSLLKYVNSKAKILKHFRFNDHYNFKKYDIEKIINYYSQIDSQEKLILTTEKDATRIVNYESCFMGISIAYLPVHFKFHTKSNFNNLIQKYVEQNRVDSKFSEV